MPLPSPPFGAADQVLTTNAGATALEWKDLPAGMVVGGGDGEIQFNNDGDFGASQYLKIELDTVEGYAKVFAHGYSYQLLTDAFTGGVTTLDFAKSGLVDYSTAVLQPVVFESSNLAAGRVLSLRLIGGGESMKLTFPEEWSFMGVMPPHISANKYAKLSLESFGTTDNDVVATYIEEEGGSVVAGGSASTSCVAPDADQLIWAEPVTTTGCYQKPFLRFTWPVHQRHGFPATTKYWVTCTPGPITAGNTLLDVLATMGLPTCDDTGNTLLEGKLYTEAELQAGIDLNAVDSVNAPALDGSGARYGMCHFPVPGQWVEPIMCRLDNPTGWIIRVVACNVTGCLGGGSTLCWDDLYYPLGSPRKTLVLYEGYRANGSSHFSGSSLPGEDPLEWHASNIGLPAFKTLQDITVGVTSGSSLNYLIQIMANVEHYAALPPAGSGGHLGDDSFGATDYKIEIQYDTSCNSTYPCDATPPPSSGPATMLWVDGIDNDTYLAAGDGGAGNEQTFDVVEADCWNEDYIYVRYRIIAMGECGTYGAEGRWTETLLGVLDVAGATAQCSGGP